MGIHVGKHNGIIKDCDNDQTQRRTHSYVYVGFNLIIPIHNLYDFILEIHICI